MSYICLSLYINLLEQDKTLTIYSCYTLKEHYFIEDEDLYKPKTQAVLSLYKNKEIDIKKIIFIVIARITILNLSLP